MENECQYSSVKRIPPLGRKFSDICWAGYLPGERPDSKRVYTDRLKNSRNPDLRRLGIYLEGRKDLR